MENTNKHRVNLRKRVINSALAVIVALAAIDAVSVPSQATFLEDLSSAYATASALYSYQRIAQESIIDISVDEYAQLLCMTMAESGHHSEEMQNGCASAAINQCIQNNCTMEETLNRSGAFGNGSHKFRDEEGKWREVELSDVNYSVIKATKDALLGNDVTSEIGGAIGFYAPNHQSDEANEYFDEHISGGETMQIENVVFFSEWK